MNMYVYIHRHMSMCVPICCFLTTVRNASVNMEVQISFQNSDFISFGYIVTSRIVESYGSSIHSSQFDA